LQNDVTDVGFAGYPDVLFRDDLDRLVLTMLGSAMREPVITTSSISILPASGAVAGVCACVTAASTLTVIVATATRSTCGKLLKRM